MSKILINHYFKLQEINIILVKKLLKQFLMTFINVIVSVAYTMIYKLFHYFAKILEIISRVVFYEDRFYFLTKQDTTQTDSAKRMAEENGRVKS